MDTLGLDARVSGIMALVVVAYGSLCKSDAKLRSILVLVVVASGQLCAANCQLSCQGRRGVCCELLRWQNWKQSAGIILYG